MEELPESYFRIGINLVENRIDVKGDYKAKKDTISQYETENFLPCPHSLIIV